MPKRIDQNQNEIVKLLRKMGATVLILSDVGKGCPDILVALNKYNVLVEIKNGESPPSQRFLTLDEQKFFNMWKGEVIVIKNKDEAIELLNNLRTRNVPFPLLSR